MRWQTFKESLGILAVLGGLAVASFLWLPWLGWLWVALILFTFSFFRDPDRPVPADPGDVVAAADGTVVAVEDLEETEVTRAPMRRVAIFLSVFNVHTNRAPLDGRVTYSRHVVGKFLDARDPECSKVNACRTWGFETARGTLVVRQITGAIARRIVAWSQVGDAVKKGDRFGMIRFGSRTEIYMPLTAVVTVKPGDAVKGGETVIARLP